MQNSRLFELLPVATYTDLKEIGRCVASPMFNRKASVSVLWDYLYRSNRNPKNHQNCRKEWLLSKL
jgi:hypothetical protein